VLLARIRALLRRPHDSVGNVLVAGDLSLDTIGKEVKRGGKVIRLSAKEYALLEYLLRNKGKVLSKQNIIHHVWDFDADVLPNNVEVFITYLRSKIDRPFASPALITTVRGFGYKIEP
jgi:DNA-binding response OmpR family regulator